MFTTINSLYSPESIGFQNVRFHKALTALFDEHRAKGSKDTSEFEMALAKCIKDHTNINYDVSIGDLPMMTEPPMIDKNSPLIEGYGWENASLSKNSLSDIRKNNAKEVRALIDLNAGWVDGYFAELAPIRMYVNAPMVFGNKGLLYKLFDGREYTSGELAAIIEHEVGHAWAFFEMIVRFRTTNQIMMGMLRELEGSQDYGKREIIIREASDMLNMPEIDAQDLKHKKDLTVYTVFISNLARKNRTQSGAAGYDINSFEALADQFATRHGAGRDLVTGLDKMYKGSIYRRGWAAYFFAEFLKIAVFILGIAAVSVGAPLAAYNVFIILMALILSDSHHDWYDKAGYRFKRIRNQLIEELKDPKTSKEDSARIREDIEIIDKVNEKYKDHTQLLGLVYDYLIPSGVAKRKEIEFQQQLEGLASNKLFYYANRLKNA